jgi:hypothetical protein
VNREKYYYEWIKRSFSGPFNTARIIAALMAMLVGLIKYLRPNIFVEINQLTWLVPFVVLFIYITIDIFRIPYSLYKELLDSKAEEYNKYNDDAKKDRLHRIFCILYKYGESERNTCTERIIRWEQELQRTIIDHFPEEVIRRYRLNINMISGPDHESITKNRFEWAMDFVKKQLDSDFNGTLTPL